MSICTTIATSISQLPVGLITNPNTFYDPRDNKQSRYTPQFLLRGGAELRDATKEEEFNWKEEQKETPGSRRVINTSIHSSVIITSTKITETKSKGNISAIGFSTFQKTAPQNNNNSIINSKATFSH